MASRLHFTKTSQHQVAARLLGPAFAAANKTGTRRVLAEQGAAHGVPAQTPSPTRMKTHVSAKPDSDQFQRQPLRISTKLTDSDLHLFQAQ